MSLFCLKNWMGHAFCDRPWKRVRVRQPVARVTATTVDTGARSSLLWPVRTAMKALVLTCREQAENSTTVTT